MNTLTLLSDASTAAAAMSTHYPGAASSSAAAAAGLQSDSSRSPPRTWWPSADIATQLSGTKARLAEWDLDADQFTPYFSLIFRSAPFAAMNPLAVPHIDTLCSGLWPQELRHTPVFVMARPRGAAVHAPMTGRYQCAFGCSKQFGAKEAYENHYRKEHLGAAAKRYQCSTCPASYAQATALSRHKKSCTGVMPKRGKGPKAAAAAAKSPAKKAKRNNKRKKRESSESESSPEPEESSAEESYSEEEDSDE